eukprot:GHVU01191821.1.p1 GENE.GHVU01191821.1~~GHVU01191821.1.p1  ORF type:complete len:111 (-),score=1.64 GHVU01191821.1:97-429(-)
MMVKMTIDNRAVQHGRSLDHPMRSSLGAHIHSYTHTLIHAYTHSLIHPYTHTSIHSDKMDFKKIVHSVLRPPRDEYSILDLGPPDFRLPDGCAYKRLGRFVDSLTHSLTH